MTFGSFQAQLRPLVEVGWKCHAGLYGVSADDRQERDSWYRTNLFAACRISSTKEADERQRVALIAHFRRLVPGEQPAAPVGNVEPFPGIRVDEWTPGQHRAFVKLAKTAFAAAYAREDPGADVAFEPWLAAKMQEAFNPDEITGRDGLWHLGGRKQGFDKAMGTLAVIAVDRYWLDRTAEGTEKRLRWQLDRFLADLSWLEGKPVGWKYVLGIHKQAHHGLPEKMADVTAQQLVDVLSMLDTQIRRLCKRWDLRPCLCPTREPTGTTPASLDLHREWAFYHYPTPGHIRGPDGKLLQQQEGVA